MLVSSCCPFDGYRFAAQEGTCGICGTARPQVLVLDPNADRLCLQAGSTLVLPAWSPDVFILERAGDGYVARVWERILWKRQALPDNYTDPRKFLQHMKMSKFGGR